MLNLKTVLAQADAFAARLFPQSVDQKAYASSIEIPVTESCIPSRRRRARRQLVTGSGELLRSTWF